MTELQPLLGEIFLAGSALFILLVGVLARGAIPFMLSVIALLGTLFIVVVGFTHEQITVFQGFLLVDSLGQGAKILIIIGALASVLLGKDWVRTRGFKLLEYHVLILVAVLGMMVMVSAHHLLSVYLGLELTSLSLYILAAFDGKNSQSAEAGLKYFIMGSLASCILLYGFSFIYGFVGSMEFDQIANAVNQEHYGLVFAMVLVIAAIGFKIAAAPFHQWSPDVYHGAPTPVTSLFVTSVKVASLILLIRILYGPLVALAEYWHWAMALLGGLSLLWGSFAALSQNNFKRLIAYSAITNVGYILVALSTTTIYAINASFYFMVIYVITNIGVFSALVLLRSDDGQAIDYISNVKGLARTQPIIAFALMVFMFSMVGIPPLAGFFGKIAVFNAMLSSGSLLATVLALFGVLISVVAAYYYLRIIRTLYFADQATATVKIHSWGARSLMVLSFVLLIIFAFGSSYIYDGILTVNMGIETE